MGFVCSLYYIVCLTGCDLFPFTPAPLTITQAVYGEKLISVEAPPSEDGTTSKIEYRVWNPFRSKLAAAILGGVDGIHITPGAKVRKRADSSDNPRP